VGGDAKPASLAALPDIRVAARARLAVEFAVGRARMDDPYIPEDADSHVFGTEALQRAGLRNLLEAEIRAGIRLLAQIL
jgi:hypothetical protein